MDVCFVELEAFTAEVMRVADEETLRLSRKQEI